MISQDTAHDLRDLLIEGLVTDGAHHKQYYLEAALKIIISRLEFEETKSEFEWESGIPG
jgi:hypothetical protein